MIICYEFFGKINRSFKTTMSEECTKILNTLGKKEMGALESYIKSGGANAVGKRVLESVMEKTSKATPLAPSKTLNPKWCRRCRKKSTGKCHGKSQQGHSSRSVKNAESKYEQEAPTITMRKSLNYHRLQKKSSC